jgi:hypothetical protein
MKRPKNLDKHYGWCNKVNHGVIFFKEEGCHKCKTESVRKKEGLCCAILAHGPGHQSKTYCEIKGRHTIHQCTYGCYDERAEWKGSKYKIKCTGYFDEPPIIRE